MRGTARRQSGALTTKNHRHPTVAARAPASRGPKAEPAPLTAPHAPMAPGRRRSSNTASTTASEVVKQAADARPWAARAPMSTPVDGATAHSALATPKAPTPPRRSRRGPTRSASRPAVSSSAPNTSGLAFMTQPRAVASACRSAPIDGSRSPIPLTSRDWASRGRHIAPSTHQARREAGPTTAGADGAEASLTRASRTARRRGRRRARRRRSTPRPPRRRRRPRAAPERSPRGAARRRPATAARGRSAMNEARRSS